MFPHKKQIYKSSQKAGLILDSFYNSNFRRRFSTSATTFNKTNHYDNLNLSRNSTVSEKEIKSSFKKLSLKYHPDILKSQNLSNEELDAKNQKYLSIKKSYETLMDPTLRSQHDSKLSSELRSRASRRSSAPSSFSNQFHYTRSPRVQTPNSPYKFTNSYYPNTQDEVPHFDFDKHFKRNLKNEKRMNERKTTIHLGSVLNHNLNNRNLSNGIKKDIHGQNYYNNNNNGNSHQQRHYRSTSCSSPSTFQESKNKSPFLFTVVGLMALCFTIGARANKTHSNENDVSSIANSIKPLTSNNNNDIPTTATLTANNACTANIPLQNVNNSYSSQLLSNALNGSSSPSLVTSTSSSTGSD